MEITTSVFVFCVVLTAGTVQAVTGFAYALLAVPLLTLVAGPREAIILVLFTGILMKTMMVFRTWQEGEFSRIGLIFAASIAGSLPGLYVLQWLDDGALKIFISIALLVCTAALCTECRIVVRRKRLAQLTVGALSGFLAVTTAFNGPPVVLYMMNEKIDKVRMRADLVRYFMLGNIVTLALTAYFGRIPVGPQLPLYALISVPAVILSWWMGNRVFQRMDPQLFRRVAIVIIGGSALFTMGSSLAAWIARN